MPAYTATAPGKIILFGEHAVVYGRPAIAIPVPEVQARVYVSANPRSPAGNIMIKAPDIDLEAKLDDLPADHPIAFAVQVLQSEIGVRQTPACTIQINSTIPIAAGMGSGAAVSVAVMRALSAFLGHPLPDERVSALAYEVEKLYHGTPSGVDNTVIAFKTPVFYQREHPIEKLSVKLPVTLVIGDTGVSSSTAMVVGDVRRAWQTDTEGYEAIFDQVANLVLSARRIIDSGGPAELGPLMDENHQLLKKIRVSSPELDKLVLAAKQAGAIGAKLSGAGRGGNMISVVEPELALQVSNALEEAGAVRTLITRLFPDI